MTDTKIYQVFSLRGKLHSYNEYTGDENVPPEDRDWRDFDQTMNLTPLDDDGGFSEEEYQSLAELVACENLNGTEVSVTIAVTKLNGVPF